MYNKDNHEWLSEVIKMGSRGTKKDDNELNDILRLVYSLGVKGVGVNVRVDADGSYEILVNPPLLGFIEEHEIDPDASEK